MIGKMMNCKPGKLAVIVMCPTGTEHLRGKIIRVTTLADARDVPPKSYPRADWADRWNYEGRRLKTARGFTILWVNDCCLRPICGEDLERDAAPQQLELIDA